MSIYFRLWQMLTRALASVQMVCSQRQGKCFFSDKPSIAIMLIFWSLLLLDSNLLVDRDEVRYRKLWRHGKLRWLRSFLPDFAFVVTATVFAIIHLGILIELIIIDSTIPLQVWAKSYVYAACISTTCTLPATKIFKHLYTKRDSGGSADSKLRIPIVWSSIVPILMLGWWTILRGSLKACTDEDLKRLFSCPCWRIRN